VHLCLFQISGSIFVRRIGKIGWHPNYNICNLKFGAKPNVSPPKSNWGGNLGVKFLTQQSRGPISNAIVYAKCAFSTEDGSTCAPITFLLVDQSSIFLFSAGRIIFDNVVFHLLISVCVPEILAVQVKSCSTARRILVIFLSSQILRGCCPPKIVPPLSPPCRGTSGGKLVGLFLLPPKL